VRDFLKGSRVNESNQINSVPRNNIFTNSRCGTRTPKGPGMDFWMNEGHDKRRGRRREDDEQSVLSDQHQDGRVTVIGVGSLPDGWATPCQTQTSPGGGNGALRDCTSELPLTTIYSCCTRYSACPTQDLRNCILEIVVDRSGHTSQVTNTTLAPSYTYKQTSTPRLTGYLEIQR
jgi:hypothetical protein